MPLIKTNISGYYKDSNTNAIINTNDDYEHVKKQKMKSKEFDDMKNKVNNIESDMRDIKNLLLQMVNGKN
jgi:hypothetical protein